MLQRRADDELVDKWVVAHAIAGNVPDAVYAVVYS